MRKLTALGMMGAISLLAVLTLFAQTSKPPTKPKPAQPVTPSSSDDGPSLQDTIQWIKNALATNGAASVHTDGNGGWKTDISWKNGLDHNTACQVVFVEHGTQDADYPNASTTHDLWDDAITLNLHDLDPSALKMKTLSESGTGYTSRGIGGRVTASTTDLAKTISLEEVVKREGGTSSSTSQSSNFELYVSEDFGQRLLNALSHAVTLCGGKKSAV